MTVFPNPTWVGMDSFSYKNKESTYFTVMVLNELTKYNRYKIDIFLSGLQEKGTTKTVNMAMIIPPKEGIAIGTIISELRPSEVSTGTGARMAISDIE
uniref:hypothetical protein n=1 Tax=Candidatus Electrothrix sp. TaxID=2170559 RepID=UPI00405663F1